MRFRLLALLSVTALTLAGCGGASAPAPHAASYLYTMAAPTVTPPSGITSSYPVASTGTPVAATSSASLSANYLGFGIRGDGKGNIYSLGSLQTAYGLMVNVYSAANGVLTLTRSFTYSNNAPFPQSFAVDPAGVVYVSDGNNNTLLKFAADATGAATPLIYSVGTAFTSMVTDSAGDLYVSTIEGHIYEYLAGFTTATPAKSLAYYAIGSTAGISTVSDMAIDSSSNIYLTGYTVLSLTPFISEYSSASGTMAPFKTITGSSTLLVNPVALAVDAVGNIYEEDAPTTVVTPHANTIYTFSSTATGNAVPTSNFTPATLTQAPATFVGLVAY